MRGGPKGESDAEERGEKASPSGPGPPGDRDTSSDGQKRMKAGSQRGKDTWFDS